MKNSEMELLKDYIRFKENRDNKYLVVDKKYISNVNYEFGVYTFTIIKPPSGEITHYEFAGDSAIGKVMELYEELYKKKED